MGHGVGTVEGAGFNQRIPLDNGSVKFTRDWREGLEANGPVDSRLHVIRIDGEDGEVIAGWVRFAVHPACVIFDAPLSAEYPGYMSEKLSETVSSGAPVLYAYGAAGDVTCIPMFGTESDTKKLGLRIAETAVGIFDRLKTKTPRHFQIGSATVDIPLAAMPSVEVLDKEIEEIEQFKEDLDVDPTLEWVIGINCKKDWPVETKKAHVSVLSNWAKLARKAVKQGKTFPKTWPSVISGLVIDDLALVYYPGEPFTRIGLGLSARAPMAETLLMAKTNGDNGYLGTDDDIKRGGYEMYTFSRSFMMAEDLRPLPYATGAAECFLSTALEMIDNLSKK